MGDIKFLVLLTINGLTGRKVVNYPQLKQLLAVLKWVDVDHISFTRVPADYVLEEEETK